MTDLGGIPGPDDERRRERVKQGPAGSMVGGGGRPSDSRPDAQERMRGRARLAEARARLAEVSPAPTPELPAPRPVVCEHPNARDGWCADCETPLGDGAA